MTHSHDSLSTADSLFTDFCREDEENPLHALAQGLRMPVEHVLAYMAGILGGVAGPVASMRGFFGERQVVSSPLVLAGAPGAIEHLLHALFLEPLLRYSDLSRLASQSTHPDVLASYDKEYHERGRRELCSELGADLIDQTERLVEDGGIGGFEEIAAASQIRRRLHQIQQPSLILSSPAPEDFGKLREDVLDGWPLIVDPEGRMVEGALQRGRKGDRWREMVEQLTRYQGAGSDEVLRKGKGDSPGIAQRVRAPFLFHLGRDRLGEALGSEAVGPLLSHALLLGPRIQKREKTTVEAIQTAAKSFRRSLKDVILTRRHGRGVDYEVRDFESSLVNRLEEYWSRIDQLDQNVRSFCRGLHGLPFRLLWTYLVLVGSQLRDMQRAALCEPVMAAADVLMDEHVRLVRTVLEEEWLRVEHQRMAEFYRKLQKKGPCQPRDVFRTYKDQRRSIHDPVLDRLLDLGAVRYRSGDQKLEAVDQAGPPWDPTTIVQSLS